MVFVIIFIVIFKRAVTVSTSPDSQNMADIKNCSPSSSRTSHTTFAFILIRFIVAILLITATLVMVLTAVPATTDKPTTHQKSSSAETASSWPLFWLLW